MKRATKDVVWNSEKWMIGTKAGVFETRCLTEKMRM